MHATATKASSLATAVQSDTAAERKAVSIVTGSAQQVPLWADRAMPAALPMAAASGVQFSLRVNAPDDKYEREADQVAEQVMRWPAPAVQRKSCACGRPAGADGMCGECRRKQLLQRKANSPGPQDSAGVGTGVPPQIQTNLKIGGVDDRYEREADQVAAQVMRMSQPVVQRRCAICEEEEQAASPALALKAMSVAEAAVQPEKATPEEGTPAPLQLTPTSLSSGGFPLPPALQAFYEDRFQYDFSRVRVHTGKSAAEKADALQAHAFTFSSHIYLGSGKALVPSTLLAHELTHVIQQTSPQPKEPAGAEAPVRTKTADRASAFGTASAPASRIQQDTGRQPLVQGDFYWVPLVAKTKGSGFKGSGGMTGNQIEKELDPHLAGWAMSTQVDIPNGNRDGTGLGFVGRADLYKGTPIGIRFVDPAKGTCNGQPLGTVTDKKGAGPARMNGSSGRPDLAGGKIANVAGAPDAITLGEIKPASKKWILFGQQQVANYKQGIEFAREQTNCMLKQTGSSEPQWPKITLDNIQQGTHPLPSALQFTPGVTTPGSTYSLGIGTFMGTAGVGMKGKGSVGDDIGTKITFNPLTDLNPPAPITGDMYAQIDNLGVLAYFFRPNLSQAAINTLITTRHKSFRKVEEARTTTAFATRVQDDIITTLTAPPHIVTFSWHHRSLEAGQQPQPVPVSPLPQAGKPLPIQTKPKKSNPKKLEDRFKLAAWNSNLSKLSTRFKQEEKTDDFKQLKFIHLLYETEEQYRDDKLPNELGSLPSEDTLKAEIGTEKTDSSGKKTGKVTKTLPDVYPWLDFWTDARIKPLGFFRDKFGSSFVVVLNKFTELRDKIRDKFKSAFDSQPSGTSGKAKMIAKALGKALVQLAKILVPHTTELVMTAVKTGIEKKLNHLFDLDQLKAVAREKLEEEFGKFTAPLVEFKNGVEAHIKQTIETYTGDLTWIKQVMDLSKVVGPIAEAAAIAIQCGTPPGWGCLKILLRSLQDCAIEAALNICAVQKEIANLVAALGPIANLPATLAQTIMDVLRKAAPDGLKDIFDEQIPQQPFPSGDEIECEDTPPRRRQP